MRKSAIVSSSQMLSLRHKIIDNLEINSEIVVLFPIRGTVFAVEFQTRGIRRVF